MRNAAYILVVSVLALAGCSMPNPVGGRITQGIDGATLDAPSPVSISIVDKQKSGTASGTGPARFTSVTGEGVQTLQTGTVPRDLFLQLPDGTKLNLSTGTDISAEGLTFDPKSGAFAVKKFSTITSEPVRAANEGLDRLVQIINTLTPAQKDAQLAYFDSQAKVAEGITKAVLEAVIAGLTGKP